MTPIGTVAKSSRKVPRKRTVGQLHGVAESVVLAAFAGDGGAVGIIQVKIARELIRRGLAGIPAVAFALCGA